MTGVILLPDNWTAPAGISFTPGWLASGTDFPTVNNTYNTWDWKKMEEAGAVFLPAGGWAYNRGSDYGYYCSLKYGLDYWVAPSTVAYISGNSIDTNFTSTDGNYPLTYASIRLVVDAN